MLDLRKPSYRVVLNYVYGSDIQFKCMVTYPKDKSSVSVYADITFFTNIYLNTFQIIDLSKNVVSYAADVDYTVCDRDVHII